MIFDNKNIAELKNDTIFASLYHAKVAQLVERQPSKLNVASSNLVFRSKDFIFYNKVFFFTLYSCKILITEKTFLFYKLFNLSPKNNKSSIGIASKITKVLFVVNKIGFNKSVRAKPPIAPPKCAA